MQRAYLSIFAPNRLTPHRLADGIPLGGQVRHRNSHDKTFPIGIAYGSKVFVCDNLAFVGDHVIRRKHTVKARRELPGLITDIVRTLQDQRIAQNQKLLTYQGTELADDVADPRHP